MNFKKIIVITGHYGAGKTNISANLALNLTKEGNRVCVVDLDIVNPYFRTADFKKLFIDKGVNVVASKYANSTLDIPSLSFDIRGIVSNDGYTIIDVGGNDEGAKALGRYTDVLLPDNTDMFYVVNKYRYLTQNINDTLSLLREIEKVSSLKCTGIINNSNLGTETVCADIASSLPYAREIAKRAGTSLLFTAGRRDLNCGEIDFPIDIWVKPVWV